MPPGVPSFKGLGITTTVKSPASSLTILTALDLQVQNKSNLMLNYETVFGRKCITFRGIPLREQETLLDTEAAVVGA